VEPPSTTASVGEILRQPRELGDLGRAYEGKILRIKEDDLPFSGKAVCRQRLEGALSLFFLLVKAGLYADNLKGRELVSNSEHSSISVG
jgi:hypothetical protein